MIFLSNYDFLKAKNCGMRINFWISETPPSDRQILKEREILPKATKQQEAKRYAISTKTDIVWFSAPI